MGKLNRYNQMMAYLTRPPRPQQQETSVERLGMMAGGMPSLKFMIDFILKFGPEVSKVGGKISREFLEFMGKKNPQNILNVYEDVRKKLQKMGDVKQKINVPKEGDVKIGEAPKTDLKKVKSKVEADKRITQELADEGQIEVNEETASDMTEFMKKNDPEGFKKIQKIVDDINNKNIPGEAPEATSKEKLYDEYIYYRDELKNFTGSFDDFIIARRKAGSLLAEETPLSAEAVKRKQNAEGGLIGGGMIEGEDLGSRTGFAEPLPTNIQNWLKETFPEIKFEFSPRKKYGLVLGDEGYRTVYDATQNKLKNPNFVYKTKAEAARETGEKNKRKS